MEPITREEYYLAKIAGTYEGNTPEPVTIEEYYLATMAGDYSGNTPQPVTRLQYYMAKVAGVWDGSIPAPVTRLEYYWAAIASGEGKVFPPVTREEHFLVLVADAYSVVLTVVTGNPALLENSKGNRGLESLTLYGKSKQVSTTGTQLVNLPDTNATISNGITWECKNGIITANGTTTMLSSSIGAGIHATLKIPAGDYYISGKNKNIEVYISIEKEDGSKEYHNSSFSVDREKTVTAFAQIYEAGVTVNNEKVYIMLNSGSTALPWEPYTGGNPSPSPEYPQEIKSTGQSGEIEVEVLGKNLIPFPYPILGGAGTQIEREGVKYTVQSDGGIRCVGTPTAVEYINLSRIKFSDVGLHATHPTDGKIVLSGEKMTYDPSNYALFICITSDQLGKPIDTVVYPQIELGTVATEYEPYKPAQKLIISTPNGLPGIPVSSGGNYTDEKGQQWVCDEVDFKKGVYVQRVAKEIPNTSLGVGETPDVKGRYSFTKAFKNIYKNGDYKCLISHGIYGRWGTKKDTWAMVGTAFVYSPEERTTEDKLKEKILSLINSDNPLTFLGQLETPIEKPLTTEQLAKYKALRTYSPTTTVINDAGAGMSVGYAKMK